MTVLVNCFEQCSLILSNPYVLLCVYIVSLSFKLGILVSLASQILKTVKNKSPLFLLVLVLISSIISDTAWVISIVRSLWLPDFYYKPYLFMIRVAWAFTVLLYQSLSLFLESLTTQRIAFNLRQKLCVMLSGGLFLSGIGIAILTYDCNNASERPVIEFLLRNTESYYVLFVLILPILVQTLWKIRMQPLPRILKKQLKLLLSTIIVPMWVLDILQLFPITFSPSWTTNSYSAACISTILLTLAAYYCAKKVIAFRFLNLSNHVKSLTKFNFIDDFKGILEQFSHATSYIELGTITQNLFKKAFGIASDKTTLYIRKVEQNRVAPDPISGSDKTVTLVENFLDQPSKIIVERLQQLKILIYDEIAFNDFQEPSEETKLLVAFLDAINADIFLPLYERSNLIAYIIVERHAQPDAFYGDVERDEMLVFASYLGNIINLLQSRNLKLLLHQEKELKEELYQKHQEINQYKESIRLFLRGTRHREIGIIFYKNRSFVFGNKAAKELINLNVNTQQGHPLTKALQYIAKQVDEFKSPASCLAHDGNGNKLILAGVPNLERNNVIITVYKPELTDLIKQQVDALKDPTQWDYLLYLETTKSGKLVNQLIPGNGETLLNFKINLLKTALSSKAVLLHMPEEDLLSMVDLLHHISLREQLRTIKLTTPTKSTEIAWKLFGINPLFGIAQEEKPLLEQLNDSGTLFIQNVEYLDLETQKYLAEFLKYGLYKVFKSDQHMASNVRIICSTNKNLQTLMHEGTFSPELLCCLITSARSSVP